MPTPRITTRCSPEPDCFATAVATYYKKLQTPEVEPNQQIDIDIEVFQIASSKATNKKNERIRCFKSKNGKAEPRNTKSSRGARKNNEKKDFTAECYELFYVYIKQAKKNLKSLILEFDTQLKNDETNLRHEENSMHCLLYVYRTIFAFIDNEENLDFHLNELGWCSDETYLFESSVNLDNIEMFMDSREWIVERMNDILISPQEWISVNKMTKILKFISEHCEEFDEYDSLISKGDINQDTDLLLQFVELNLVYLHELCNYERQQYGEQGYWVNAYFYDRGAPEVSKKVSQPTKLNKSAELNKKLTEQVLNQAAMQDPIMTEFNKRCQEDTIDNFEVIVKSSTLDMVWTPENTPKSTV